jgi:drug/metabolite transporter (DMT)-like permease
VRPGAVVGALLILAGIIMFSVGGFSFRSKERVAEVGPVEVTAERKHSVAVPPLLAGLAVIGGLVLIVASRRRAG